MARLPRRFFRRPDVTQIARELLGTVLCTRCDGRLTAGRIVETEAYAGPEDRASHAWNNRRTPRTEVMYADGGCAYVYLCYGMHHLFNVVTNRPGIPHAILVRAVEPVAGIAVMAQRRGVAIDAVRLTSGPGALAQALGITTALTGRPLTGPDIWFRPAVAALPDRAVISLPRVGVDYAGADARRPWRFAVRDSPYVTHRPARSGRDRP